MRRFKAKAVVTGSDFYTLYENRGNCLSSEYSQCRHMHITKRDNDGIYHSILFLFYTMCIMSSSDFYKRSSALVHIGDIFFYFFFYEKIFLTTFTRRIIARARRPISKMI